MFFFLLSKERRLILKPLLKIFFHFFHEGKLFQLMKCKILLAVSIKQKLINNFKEVLLDLQLQVFTLQQPFLNLINK